MKIFPIFIPQQGCKFQCIYCNQFNITGVDKIDWEITSQQLANFTQKNSGFDKEIAFFGGTFTAISIETRELYYSKVRAFVGERTTLRYSTRPDAITNELLDEGLRESVTTIELGVQSLSNSVLSQSGRGYSKQQVFLACKMIKERGFKLGVQLMPGLPGFTEESFNETIQGVISIDPDFVRIYPLLVLEDTPLTKLYNENLYTPLSLEDAIKYSSDMLEEFEINGIKVIKIGLHSDIDVRGGVIAGPFHPNFGELVMGEVLIRGILGAVDFDCHLAVSNKNISLLKGNKRYTLKQLEERCDYNILSVSVDKNLSAGKFIITKP